MSALLSLARYRMIRSRVISGYSRDIWYIHIPVHELLNLIWNEWRIETGRKKMRIYRYGSRTGFLGVLILSVSVKDRTVVGPTDHVWIVLTACREYEVIETGKPSTALLQKYRNSHPTPRVVEWPRRNVLHVLLLVVSRRARLTICRWAGSCSSRRGGEWFVRVVWRGLCVPCWLGPPCTVKSNRFAMTRGYESPDLFVTS